MSPSILDPSEFDEQVATLAVNLFSQQLWCWGQDILSPEGNWLLKVGFTRTPPPAERDDCSSVYSLYIPEDKQVILRGFGVFFGDLQRGSIFLPRYRFQPRYSCRGWLDRAPWTDSELPDLRAPLKSQTRCCASLTLELIDWIRSYEVAVLEHLGVSYRVKSLTKWDNGKREVIPADEMPRAWRLLGNSIIENSRLLFA